MPMPTAAHGSTTIYGLARRFRSTVTSILDDAPVLVEQIAEEPIADLAFHRDGGRIPVMRGRSGAPVLVADRRLIAAGL